MLGPDPDVITRRLSLALLPVDVVTGRKGEVRLRVVIERGERKAFRNLSGFYCFEDLPVGTHVIRIRPDGVDRRHYVEQTLEHEVVLPEPSEDPHHDVREVQLLPAPDYPFAPGSTLVRGLVTKPDGERLEGVDVALVGRPERAATDADGNFVLLAQPDAAGTPQTLVVQKGAASTALGVQILAGQTISAGTLILDAV